MSVGLTPGHVDVSLWYPLKAAIGEKLEFDSREFKSVKWFKFADAETMAGRIDPNLSRFIEKLRKRLESDEAESSERKA